MEVPFWSGVENLVTPLLAAVSFGHVGLTNALIGAGADLEAYSTPHRIVAFFAAVEVCHRNIG